MLALRTLQLALPVSSYLVIILKLNAKADYLQKQPPIIYQM